MGSVLIGTVCCSCVLYSGKSSDSNSVRGPGLSYMFGRFFLTVDFLRDVRRVCTAETSFEVDGRFLLALSLSFLSSMPEIYVGKLEKTLLGYKNDPFSHGTSSLSYVIFLINNCMMILIKKPNIPSKPNPFI